MWFESITTPGSIHVFVAMLQFRCDGNKKVKVDEMASHVHGAQLINDMFEFNGSSCYCVSIAQFKWTTLLSLMFC